MCYRRGSPNYSAVRQHDHAQRPVDAGKLEIESRFHLARPMWSYDGLETLNEA